MIADMLAGVPSPFRTDIYDPARFGRGVPSAAGVQSDL